MPNHGMEQLANLLATDQDLQKAALSGLSKSVEDTIRSKNLSVSPEVISSLGQIANANPGSPIADDYVVRAVSSVVAAVKVKVIDVADDLVQLNHIQNRLAAKIGSNIHVSLPTINR